MTPHFLLWSQVDHQLTGVCVLYIEKDNDLMCVNTQIKCINDISGEWRQRIMFTSIRNISSSKPEGAEIAEEFSSCGSKQRPRWLPGHRIEVDEALRIWTLWRCEETGNHAGLHSLDLQVRVT